MEKNDVVNVGKESDYHSLNLIIVQFRKSDRVERCVALIGVKCVYK